ncbi:helix-turn-helix domain-containing protein [Nonomuraea sp. NPDC050783]|uniref:helix-turn-helix domain-containing protein n=1 Tax=Nonomuraea sp. NPDC050783 TaxID=3154634 RepID=UPI0034651056
MVRVRGHWRRTPSGGRTWVRPYTRGTAAVAGGGLVIIIAVLIFALWPRSSAPTDPPAQAMTTAPATPPAAESRSSQPSEPVRLANGLRGHRERAGLTTAEAGRRAGLPASRITGMENGTILPTTSQIDTLSRVYGLTIDQWSELLILRLSIP